MLDAALARYASQGIAATKLRDIAREAGATPALLHYYFGDGKHLLEAVIEERILPAIMPMRDAVVAAGDDITAAVAAFVNGMSDTIEKHPWVPALWVREVLSEGGALTSVLNDESVRPIVSLMASRFAAAQARGEVSAALDPRLLELSLVSLTFFPHAGAPLWRQLLDARGLGKADLCRHTLELLQHGFRAEPRNGG
ncbi:TetR/AcrR family transcriptional regulator [Pseudoxanthomonas suwonensis]|uniref:TetR/AcrR family transcriptional regulator n=1 Tax=Pseudoxanthomonas suwonensis TaxID=314722 RepID=UPI0004B700D5|nr:TetR/AcrR family transcriptional regulator [Pseudoxanthomonas suwonensis]